MPYNNPQSDEADREPIGLDAVLVDLQADFNQIDWLFNNVFLRAYDNVFPGPDGRSMTTPQVYIGNGEYLNVSINDNLSCAGFFRAVGNERVNYQKPQNRTSIWADRELSFIFWCNLQYIEAPFKDDYIFTEKLREVFMRILADSSHVFSINEYSDENVRQVFEGYTVPEDKQYSKHPFAMLRINFTARYKTGTRPCKTY